VWRLRKAGRRRDFIEGGGQKTPGESIFFRNNIGLCSYWGAKHEREGTYFK